VLFQRSCHFRPRHADFRADHRTGKAGDRPTVHIHDGKVHAEEEFDHDLYCQVVRTGLFAMTRWEESDGLAKAFTKPEKAGQLIAPDAHVHYRSLAGKMKNEDIIPGTA
jgi:hypothetical protein